jgi:hypothetical protein
MHPRPLCCCCCCCCQVAALIECLLGPSGLKCPLASAMMTPVAGGTVQHYMSVLRTITEGRWESTKAQPASC